MALGAAHLVHAEVVQQQGLALAIHGRVGTFTTTTNSSKDVRFMVAPGQPRRRRIQGHAGSFILTVGETNGSWAVELRTRRKVSQLAAAISPEGTQPSEGFGRDADTEPVCACVSPRSSAT